MVTGEMVEQLILNGADIVKVGIGPGEYLQGDGLHPDCIYYMAFHNTSVCNFKEK